MEIKTLTGSLSALGEFELTGPNLRVSDPCYERNVWCCGVLSNCVVGTWKTGSRQTSRLAWILVRRASSMTPAIRMSTSLMADLRPQ